MKNDNFDIILVENVENCKSKDELKQRERYYIETMVCCNKNIPCRTREEWLEANHNYYKNYYQENKNAKINYQKKHYQENKEEKIDYQKNYNEENKEKIKIYQEKYRIENQENINLFAK